MRNVSLLLCALIGLAGCTEHDLRIVYADGSTGCLPSDGSATHEMGDMSMPCAAAQGLPGVPLICNDFPVPQTLVDLQGAGWDFTTQCPAGWTVVASKLQVNNFGGFMGNCIFTTRKLASGEYQDYGSLTLSVVQTVDLNATKQTASIYLGNNVVTQQVTSTTGTNPRQRNTYQIVTTALPNGGGNSYQPLFQINSGTTVGTSNTGWLIESIAVLGNKP